MKEKDRLCGYIKKECSKEHRVFFFDSTDSTNLRAAQLISSGYAVGGEVFVARRQECGRGTRGRSFFSEGGLYLSVILKMTPQMKNITAFAAVSVCRAIESKFSVKCGIKWVNDIQVDGKKLCGILCESRVCGDEQQFVIIGIGINTNIEAFPSEISDIATSLSLCGCGRCEDMSLAARIVCELERYSLFSLGEYKERLVCLGRVVTVSEPGGERITGECIDLGEDGSLYVLADGRVRRILCGDVFYSEI